MRHWEAPVQKYVQELLAGDSGPLGKNFNMRWVAAMVAEVHRVLCRGGIFMYPRDKITKIFISNQNLCNFVVHRIRATTAIRLNPANSV